MKSFFSSVKGNSGGGSSDSIANDFRHVLTVPKPTLESYLEFWRSVDAPINANGFLAALAKHLTEKNGRNSMDGGVVGVSTGSVLHTMLLLVLYTPVSAEGKGGVGHWLKQTLSSSGKSVKHPERPDLSAPLHYDSIMGMVGKADQPSELVSMVQRCSDVAAAGSDDVEDVIDSGEAASSLLFDYLRRRLQANHGVATVLSTLRGILSLGPTLIPMHKALALLHMLNELLLSCHAFTDEELKKVLVPLRGYRTWALPVGSSASLVLRSIRSELAVRGASMFQLLTREVPFMLTPFARGASARRALTDALTVHVVLDEKGDWARAFRALTMAPSTPYEEEDAARRALVSMLYVVFKGAALGISPAKLGSLTYAQLVPLAAEACVLAASLGAADDEAADQALAVAASERLKPLAEQMAALAPSQASPHRASTGESDDVRAPRLPPLTLRELETLGGGGAAVAELRAAAEQCGGKRYQYDSMLAALHERLREREASGAPRDDSPALRVCIAGGDDVLHRLVQAYVVLRCAYPRLCTAEAMRFFLVPLGRQNRMAGYVAAHDGWYRRHIYAPHCTGQPTVPHLIVPGASSSGAASKRDVTDELGGMSLGGSGSSGSAASSARERPSVAEAPMRACLTEYLRSAQACLPLMIYEVALWLTPPSDALTASAPHSASPSSKRPTEPPFLTVAFCQSLELVPALPTGGASAAEPAVSAGKGEASGVLAHVVYSMADPWGVTYGTPTVMTARFAGLGFHSHAADSAHCPSDGRLQMRCTIAGGGTSRSAAASVRSPHRYVRSASIAAGVGAAGADPGLVSAKGAGRGGATLRDSGADRFGVLVDGEYYGPFAYALVSPCHANNESEQLSLPLSTFFPVMACVD